MGVAYLNSTASARATGMLVVDDHDLVRLGLRSLVQSHAQEHGQSVQVYEARSLAQALSSYQEHGPDIGLVLLDLHLPDAHGLSGLISFKARFPHAHVVALSGISDPMLMREAIARGASTFLPKSADLAQVVNYIRSLGLLHTPDGATPTPTPAPGTDAAAIHPTRTVRGKRGETLQLTARQAQILDWLLSGHSNAEIADMAHLSEGTVKNHVSTLLLLFGVRSRAQLISELR
jgi:DNA-binding NarL/FixJ family response regulator